MKTSFQPFFVSKLNFPINLEKTYTVYIYIPSLNYILYIILYIYFLVKQGQLKFLKANKNLPSTKNKIQHLPTVRPSLGFRYSRVSASMAVIYVQAVLETQDLHHPKWVVRYVEKPRDTC